jgi:hypothetical protein
MSEYTSILCDRTFASSKDLERIFRIFDRRVWRRICLVLDGILYSKFKSGDYRGGWIQISQEQLADRADCSRSYLSTQILELQAFEILELKPARDGYLYRFTTKAQEMFRAFGSLDGAALDRAIESVRQECKGIARAFAKFTQAPIEQLSSAWKSIKNHVSCGAPRKRRNRQSLKSLDLKASDARPSGSPSGRLADRKFLEVPSKTRKDRQDRAASTVNVQKLTAGVNFFTQEDPIQKPKIINNYTYYSEVGSGDEFFWDRTGEFLDSKPEPRLTPSTELNLPSLKPSTSSIDKANIPAACDKKPTKKVLNDREWQEYQTKLAPIGVKIESVAWAIARLEPAQRAQIVDDAIAWVRQNTWIKSPAGAFVEAVRGRRKAQERSQLQPIAPSANSDFRDWYDRANKRGYVQCSQSDREHYAIVMIESENRWLPWHQARDYFAALMAADDEIRYSV